jgi:hypothetical protein
MLEPTSAAATPLNGCGSSVECRPFTASDVVHVDTTEATTTLIETDPAATSKSSYDLRTDLSPNHVLITCPKELGIDRSIIEQRYAVWRN